MAKKMRQTPTDVSFGALSREEFQQLVDAPYGEARARISDPYDLLARRMAHMIIEQRAKMLDVVVDDEFIRASAQDLANDLIELIDRWGLLR